jgi:hypothetical protein
MSIRGSYLAQLSANRDTLLPRVLNLIRACDAHPVGSGFIDIITPSPRINAFVAGLADLGIGIRMVTLWCNYTEDNRVRFGCPHGFGGPTHGLGYYSEICESDPYEATYGGSQSGNNPKVFVARLNDAARTYATEGMKVRADYSPCFVPGFWLDVPEDWKPRDVPAA